MISQRATVAQFGDVRRLPRTEISKSDPRLLQSTCTHMHVLELVTVVTGLVCQVQNGLRHENAFGSLFLGM